MASDFSLSAWLTIVTLFVLTLFINFIFKFKNKSSKPLPPGPPGWPLIGNIFDLSLIPHHTFYELQALYGPVIFLKLGAINTMVVQSSEAASELFKKCDLSFADRKTPDCMTALGYDGGSVALGAYSHYWRKVRRICTMEFLIEKRINESIPVRQKGVDELIKWIKKDADKSKENGGTGEIQLNRFLFVAAFKTVGTLMLSSEVMETKLDKAGEFFEAFLLFLEWAAKPNVSDLFPFLKRVDPQGIRRNTGKYLERLLGFVSEIVKERIHDKESMLTEKKRKDLLDALLDEGEVYEDGFDKLSVKNITIVLLEMFLAGTETTSTTIEWGMTQLLRHPQSTKKIQEEIDRVVGRTRKVKEDDLTQMPYLQATVKEILRLHPTVPLLVPRNSIEDTEFMGYFVPKHTQIFVNAWAIHRDPTTWPDPLSFKPERFLDSDVDLKGQHFQMIPFGLGRRSCLGLTLGHRMVTLTMASLLHTFDWKLPDRIGPDELDMKEIIGMTLHKKVPLKVIPCLRD